MDEKTMNLIKERMEMITKEREQFLQTANQQLFAYNAVIEELRTLLGLETPPAETTKEGKNVD